jgi:segregation and condensation protein B
VALGTHPDLSELMLSIRKEELSRDIGKAGLETLSIILYKGEVARSEIDYIRGVNSSFILRNLLIRGLVERFTNPSDSRSYLYKPTFQLMSFLGITKIEDLPKYEEVEEQLEVFIQQKDDEESEGDNPFAENLTQT